MLLELAAAVADQPDLSGADAPSEVLLQQGGTRIELRFDGRASLLLNADDLRAACRCAWCTKAKVQGAFPVALSGISIQQIKPIGAYAVNLGFSDGHDRGVFPWSYLRQLAEAGN
jgi:DUF971 family protein